MWLKFYYIFFLSLLINNGVYSFEVLSKFGTKETLNDYIFLNVSEFEVDQKIYISLTTYGYCSNYLDYGFYANLDDNDMYFYQTSDSVYYTSRTSVSTYGSYKSTYNFKIKKDSSQSNYLYLQFNCDPPVTVENTEKNASSAVVIISVIISFVACVGLIVLVIYCCRRHRRAYSYGTPYPVSYGVSPYNIQPVIPMQPMTPLQPYPPMQPVNVAPYNQYVPQNPGYNRGNPIPQGSESLRDKPEYENPKY